MGDTIFGIIIGLVFGFLLGRAVGIYEDLESIESKTLIPMHYNVEIKDGVSDTTFVYDFTDSAIWKDKNK